MISGESKPQTEADQASYDDWFKRKVEAARSDPRPSTPHEEMRALLNKRFEELAAKKLEPKDEA